MTIGTERLNRPLIFVDLVPAEVVYQGATAEKKWKRQGPSIADGNYRLRYTAFDRTPIRFGAHHGYSLWLHVLDTGQFLDVTDLANNASFTRRRLLWFLGQIRLANKWGPKLGTMSPGSIDCRLVVKRGSNEVSLSNIVAVKTPVAPWSAPLDPDLLANDPGIKYCMREGLFYGQILKRVSEDGSGPLYFTYKDSLQIEPQYRGFACIGLVGNLYGIAPGLPYEQGQHMAAQLGGAPFEWAGRPRGFFEVIDVDSSLDTDPSPDAVQMTRPMLLQFLEAPESKSGSFLVWKKGHAGLIRNGILYECKPPPKDEHTYGFTYATYDDRSESAVRCYTIRDLRDPGTGLKKGYYFLSKLPT